MAEAAEPAVSINPLKKFYFKLGQELDAGEVGALKDLLIGEQLTKEEAENVDTARGLFNLLTEKGIISEDNLKLLEELFETIDRPHLKEKVIKFQQDRGATTKREACELSMKALVTKVEPQQKDEISPIDDVTLTLNHIARRVYDSVDLSKEGALNMVEDHLEKIEGLLLKRFLKKCIECVVECETIAALETLWSQYKTGDLQAVFQKAIITDELLKSLHAEYITMEVTISEEEYRKCREEVKACEEVNKAIDEYDKAEEEYDKARYEYDKAFAERHGLEAAGEEKKKAEQRYQEAWQGLREAEKELWRKYEAWESMQASADDLEAANIQIQTMKADAKEQTEKISKEKDSISEQLKIKGEFRMKELDAKLQFKSEQEINDEIRKLKSGLERGFTSGDEKATRERISSLEASKITLREYLKLQSDIDSNIIEEKLQMEEERELFHEKEDKSEKESEVVKGISGMKIGRSGKHT